MQLEVTTQLPEGSADFLGAMVNGHFEPAREEKLRLELNLYGVHQFRVMTFAAKSLRDAHHYLSVVESSGLVPENPVGAKAKGLPDQPIGAYIVEKASLGIGNSCWVQLQFVKQTSNPGPAAVKDLEQCALDNYQQLIELYTQQKNPEANLKEMVAWAYYGVGNVAKSRANCRKHKKCMNRDLSLQQIQT